MPKSQNLNLSIVNCQLLWKCTRVDLSLRRCICIRLTDSNINSNIFSNIVNCQLHGYTGRVVSLREGVRSGLKGRLTDSTLLRRLHRELQPPRLQLCVTDANPVWKCPLERDLSSPTQMQSQQRQDHSENNFNEEEKISIFHWFAQQSCHSV